jgi:hypothetical protein
MTTESTAAPAGAAPASAPAAAPAAPAQAPAAAPAAPAVATSIDAPAAAAAPAAAPVAAPAAAPAPAPAADPAAAPAPAATTPVTYEPTGDPGLDLALSFIGQRGIGVDHPAMKAAEQGDFTLLRATLAQMGEKAPGWEHVIAAGEASYAKQIEARKGAATATQDAILSVFGLQAGKADTRESAAKEWGKVTEWAKANAEPAERAAVNAALSAGGIAAKAMAQYLYGLYKGTPGAVIEPTPVTNVGGRAATDTWALSPDGYKAEVAKLTADKRGNIDGSPEYKVLQQRRLAWRP